MNSEANTLLIVGFLIQYLPRAKQQLIYMLKCILCFQYRKSPQLLKSYKIMIALLT